MPGTTPILKGAEAAVCDKSAAVAMTLKTVSFFRNCATFINQIPVKKGEGRAQIHARHQITRPLSGTSCQLFAQRGIQARAQLGSTSQGSMTWRAHTIEGIVAHCVVFPAHRIVQGMDASITPIAVQPVL